MDPMRESAASVVEMLNSRPPLKFFEDNRDEQYCLDFRTNGEDWSIYYAEVLLVSGEDLEEPEDNSEMYDLIEEAVLIRMKWLASHVVEFTQGITEEE